MKIESIKISYYNTQWLGNEIKYSLIVVIGTYSLDLDDKITYSYYDRKQRNFIYRLEIDPYIKI